MPTIISLDLSLNATGIAFFSNGIEETHLIISKDTGILRLQKIKKRIEQFIDIVLSQQQIDLIVIENYSFSSHGRATFSIGELGGIIKLLAFEKGIKTILVAPTTLKKYVSGKGNCKKNEMLLAVYKKFGQSFDDDNRADAYGLCQIGKFLFINTSADLWQKVQILT